jgi:hypothetical protein
MHGGYFGFCNTRQFWAFEKKNQIQRIVGCGYFKKLKEPPIS